MLSQPWQVGLLSDFNGDKDVENFIQQYQKVAAVNDWSETASLLHILTHLRDGANKCGNNSTLKEVFRALHFRYGISRREARTRLAHLKRDTKLSLRDHATMVKKLVEAAYADLPQGRNCAGIILQLHQPCIPTRHLFAINLQNLAKVVEAKTEYLQLQPGHNPGPGIRQVDTETTPSQVQANQARHSEVELLF